MLTTVDDKVVKIIGKDLIIGGELLKVKFQFSYNENIDYLCMQVLEQLPFFRGRHIITSQDKYLIRSSSDPEIQECVLFIRGLQPKNDEHVCRMLFPNSDSKNRIITAFCDLIKKANALLESVEKKGEDYTMIAGAPDSLLQIKFEANPNDASLKATILNMDESLRIRDIDQVTWSNGANNFVLRSSGTPEMGSSGLYIGGTNKGLDKSPFGKTFDNVENRNRAFTAYLNLVTAINSRQITVKEEPSAKVV